MKLVVSLFVLVFAVNQGNAFNLERTGNSGDVDKIERNEAVTDEENDVNSDKPRTAFTLVRTGHFGPAPFGGEKIKWNKEVTDIGNDVNPGDDTFVVPRDSVYVFSWTVKGILVRATLRVKSGDDDEKIEGNVATAGGRSHGSGASNTIILEMKTGDEVSIYLQDSNYAVMGCGTKYACIFTGYEI